MIAARVAAQQYFARCLLSMPLPSYKICLKQVLWKGPKSSFSIKPYSSIENELFGKFPSLEPSRKKFPSTITRARVVAQQSLGGHFTSSMKMESSVMRNHI
jgi:hypothetical protein